MRLRAVILFLGLLSAASLLLAQPSASVHLSPALDAWREEIESIGERRVVLARVYMDRRRGLVYLPKDAEQRPLITQYLKNESFLGEFVKSHAMTISQPVQDGESLHVILLNMGRAEEWTQAEEAVIGREMARIWLNARDYASPAFEGKENSCLAIFAASVGQQPLIRKELERREIDVSSYRLPLLDQAVEALSKTPAKPVEEIATCPLMSRLALWVEVRQWFTPEEWDNYDEFEAQMRRHYPILERTLNEIDRYLTTADMSTPDRFQGHLEWVVHQFYGFVRLVLKRDEQAP